MEPAMAVAEELTSVPSFETPDLSLPFAEERDMIAKLKKAILMVAGKAAQKFGPNLNDEQEILMNIADMVIEVYCAESAILRAEKVQSMHGEEAAKYHEIMSKMYLYNAVDKVSLAGKEAIVSFTSGDEQKVMLMGLKRFTKTNAINTKELRREIADHMIEKGYYPY